VPRIRGASIGEHHELVWADLAEALRQLLVEHDYESITMGHIAARAGLARNTLYNYASDKSALVLALTERASRPTVERVTAIRACGRSAASSHHAGPGRRPDTAPAPPPGVSRRSGAVPLLGGRRRHSAFRRDHRSVILLLPLSG